MPGLRAAAKKTKNYDTPLDADVETDYEKQYTPQNSKDYDMRGWYKENAQTPAKPHQGHYTDKYKKPNHITFSTESKYSTKENTGGSWMGHDFAPSDQQVNTPEKKSKLKDYFKRVEKGKLLLKDK